MNTVRVRYAPSPTGNPHVGNMRTALFTYLAARKNKGGFILRIEDTDKKREVPESHQAILESLAWLGIKFDEGPILQSERLSIYRQHAKMLVDKKAAYEQDGAVYFKTPKEGKTEWVDLVGNKKIVFDNGTISDFVILKSDGYPTYHLASVVDDHLMQISHVTRGEDWISSTPRHLMLYKAFGWKPPFFAHFPNILASDRSKLSKRHGSVRVLSFRSDGYLPEAMVNFLALLGWTPPSGREILTLAEMENEFDLKDVNLAAPIFDTAKLDWLNGEYIRKTKDLELRTKIYQYLRELSGGKLSDQDHPTEEQIGKVVPLIRERIKKLSDFVPLTDFLWEKPEYDRNQYQRLNIKNQKEVLEKILGLMEKLGKPWKGDVFEKTFRELAESLGLRAGDVFQLIRVAVSGQTVTPPLFESIEILGEEETLARIREAIDFLEK